MSDLWRIHDEPEAVKRPDGGFYSEKGWLVQVEPVGTLTVAKPAAGWSFATGDAVSGFTKLPPGKYLIVEADDDA